MTHSHSDLLLKRKNNIPNGITIWEEKHLQFLRDNQDKTVEYKAKVLGCSRSVVSLKMKEIGLQKHNFLAEPGYNEVIKAPPVPDQSKPLVEKCWEESRKSNTLVVMLIPARTDTRYWHEWIFPYAKEIRFVKGRLKFESGAGNENSAPFPSAVVVFDPEWSFIYGGRTTVMERD